MFRREQIGRAVLYCGDCLDVLPTLAGFDALIMDPPYAIPTAIAQTRAHGVVRSVGDLSLTEAAFRAVFDAVANMLRPQGRAFVFYDGVSYPAVFRAAYSKFSTALLVWDKGRIGMGREFRKSHELIMHCWREDTPIFADGVGRPDILRFKPVGHEREHEAEKPIALLETLLRVCGERVCDPFMGSGSTGIAALKSGRSFVGIEIEGRFFDVACRRIEATERQGNLFDECARDVGTESAQSGDGSREASAAGGKLSL